MKNKNQNRINEYMLTFGKSLNHPSGSRQQIIEEIRADLEAHIEQRQASGKSTEEAIELALAELGDPVELAHQVSPAASPMEGPVISAFRYLAAGVVILWALAMLWLTLRPGTYGLMGPVFSLGIFLIHMPIILILWPRIIWRKNWLFGLIPAGAALLIAIFLRYGGTQEETTYTPLDPNAPTTEHLQTAQTAEEPYLTGGKIVIFSIVAGTNIFLFIAMQRRKQRLLVLAVLTTVIALTEIPFQIEEALFRAKIRKAHTQADSKTSDADLNIEQTVDGFILRWDRPLNPSFSYLYESSNEKITIFD